MSNQINQINQINKNNVNTSVSESSLKFIRRHIEDDFGDSTVFTDVDEKWNHSKLDQFDKVDSKHKNFNSYAPPMSFPNFNNDQKKKKFVQKEAKNKKKLLCTNIIHSGSCCYGQKCMYAHSLSDQQIDPIRKKAYDLLFSSNNLSHINFQNDVQLYRSLRDLTNYCNKEYCTGGYNCKHGVCGIENKKYIVCIKDLDYGDCSDKHCKFVHLTLRGLKPFYHGYSSTICSTIETNNYANIKNIKNNLNNQSNNIILNINDNSNDNSNDYISDMLSDVLSDDSISSTTSSDTKINSINQIYSTNSTNSEDECDESIFEKISNNSKKDNFDKSYVENLFTVISNQTNKIIE